MPQFFSDKSRFVRLTWIYFIITKQPQKINSTAIELNMNLSVILHFNSIHDKINYHKSDTLRWSGAKLVHYFQR
jgi:hypothetical protein